MSGIGEIGQLIDIGASAIIALVLLLRVDRHLQAQTRALNARLDQITRAMAELAEHARKRASVRRNTPREVPITREKGHD